MEAHLVTDSRVADGKHQVRLTQTCSVPAVWQVLAVLADVPLESLRLFLFQIPLQLEGLAWVAVQLEQHHRGEVVSAARFATAQPLNQQQQVRLPISTLSGWWILLVLPSTVLSVESHLLLNFACCSRRY